jgi:hypothetical protein
VNQNSRQFLAKNQRRPHDVRRRDQRATGFGLPEKTFDGYRKIMNWAGFISGGAHPTAPASVDLTTRKGRENISAENLS